MKIYYVINNNNNEQKYISSNSLDLQITNNVNDGKDEKNIKLESMIQY